MNLEVLALDKKAEKFKRLINQKARRLAKLLPQKGKIEVYLINSRRMRHLNKLFRKKDKSANVLSFQKPENFPGKELGEVYLDHFYIKKHKEDLALMLVHGVLHILGYVHEKKSDRIIMEKKEKQLWRKII